MADRWGGPGAPTLPGERITADEPKPGAEWKAPLWTMLGIFVVFKIATTAIIIYMDPNGIDEALGLFFAFHWPFILGGLAFGATVISLAILFRIRLLRVRSRRAALQAAEWRTD